MAYSDRFGQVTSSGRSKPVTLAPKHCIEGEMSTEGRRPLSPRAPLLSRSALRTQVKSVLAKAAMWWPNTSILESLPMFAPNAAGAMKDRTALTIQAASQTFPLMIELLGRTGTAIKDPTPIAAFVDTAEKRAAALELKKLFD